MRECLSRRRASNKIFGKIFGEQSSITQKFSESEDKKKFIIEHYENENRIFGPKSFLFQTVWKAI